MQLTSLDVNGEMFSPLLWSLRDGSFALARFIITDLLTISEFRFEKWPQESLSCKQPQKPDMLIIVHWGAGADRDAYYYGREKLFETHPDVVAILCR